MTSLRTDGHSDDGCESSHGGLCAKHSAEVNGTTLPSANGVHRVSIGGGIKIGSDGSYSSEYTLPQIHAGCADALVAMDYKRSVIEAFRKARDYPKGAKDAD